MQQGERPERFLTARNKLSRVERANIALVQSTVRYGWANWLCGVLQRTPGATWVDVCTRRLRRVHGLERIGPIAELDSFILASNHRSYFDLYVVTMVLIRAGLKRRMLFPVRSNFFYDHPLGLFVNGIMSFWSMYPPIFRKRERAVLNYTAVSELIELLQTTKIGVGVHPEGTRNQGSDPYTMLKAQSGIGRLIHASKKPVIPVFINGLINDLRHQVRSNFDGTGGRVNIVFGAPIDFGALLDQPGGAKTYRDVAEHTREVILTLGREERALRTEEFGTLALNPGSDPSVS